MSVHYLLLYLPARWCSHQLKLTHLSRALRGLDCWTHFFAASIEVGSLDV